MQIVGSFWNQFVFFISRSLALHTGKNCLYIQSGNFSRDSRFILNRFYFLIWNHSFYYSLASKMKNPYSWLLTLYSWPNLFVKHRNHKARRICILSQVTKCKAQTQATNRKEKVNAKQFKWIILNLHLILSRYICCCIIIFCRDCLILHVTRDGLQQTVPLKFKSVFRTQQGPYNLGINSWAYCTKQQLNVLQLHFKIPPNYTVYFSDCKISHKASAMKSKNHANPSTDAQQGLHNADLSPSYPGKFNPPWRWRRCEEGREKKRH